MTLLRGMLENGVRRGPEQGFDPGYVGSHAPAR